MEKKTSKKTVKNEPVVQQVIHESDVEPMVDAVPQEEVPAINSGIVVYRNYHANVIGFECDDIGYQIPISGLAYKVGDAIDFMIVDGKIILAE